MFQRLRSPRAAAVLAAAAASGHHQAPRHNSDQQNNGHQGPQRQDVSLHQVDLACDVLGMDQ